MDVILTFTKANIQKGWQNSSCPIHRAVARTLKVKPQNVLASNTGVGIFTDKDPFGTYFKFNVDDFAYLCQVMNYADYNRFDITDINAPPEPKTHKVVAHVDN